MTDLAAIITNEWLAAAARFLLTRDGDVAPDGDSMDTELAFGPQTTLADGSLRPTIAKAYVGGDSMPVRYQRLIPVSDTVTLYVIEYEDASGDTRVTVIARQTGESAMSRAALFQLALPLTRVCDTSQDTV